MNHLKKTIYLSNDSFRKVESITYFDAFGRPIQQKTVGVLPGNKSLMQAYQYDVHGRQTKSYLPFPMADSSLSYLQNPIPVQSAYYQALYPGKNAFSEVQFDNSPFNRVLKQAPVGENIDDVIGTSTFVFAGNEVPLWEIASNSRNIVRNGYYPAKSLLKYTLTNEQGHSVSVYKNKSGQVLMKEAADTKTIYVYDEYGRLRYVLSPLAVDAMTGPSYNPDSDEVKKLCYYYEYNQKHQLTIKQEPGKGFVMYLYDTNDRLRMSQDALQREKGQWSYINYDKLGRTVSTGIGAMPQGMPESIETTETGNTGLLSRQYYDNYQFLSPADTLLQFNQALAFGQARSLRVRGMATGSKTKVLHPDETIQWLSSVLYYDDYGRAIQSVSTNHLGGTDVVSNLYNTAGELLKSEQTHRVPGQTDVNIRYSYVYDKQGRLLKTWQRINSQDSVLVNQLNYNELGQLTQKQIHSENGGQNFLQDVDYAYNIKGQLTHMNNPESLGNDVFALRFYFNEHVQGVSHEPSKDGNISAMQYNSKNLNALQTWTYTYDNLNRLTQAVFSQNKYNETIGYDKNGNILNLQRQGKAGAVYTTIDQLSYKYNGNQLLAVNDADATDNQANGFTDNGIFKTGIPTDPLTHEYTYDVNGNLLSDANKFLDVKSYNYLNLPDSMEVGNGLTIKYLYTAGGAKLKQTTYNGDETQGEIVYSGSFVYEGTGSLKYIMTGEGRLIPEGNSYKYEYFLTDHLGNTRVIFKKSGDSALIVQEDHYYPFGMQISDQSFSVGSVPNTFLYNGKEFDASTGYYQYGFRQYDAQIGRWHVVDALAAEYYSESPYAYVGNNPTNKTDLLGLTKQDYDKGHFNYEIYYYSHMSYSGQNLEMYGFGGNSGTGSLDAAFYASHTLLSGPNGSRWVNNNEIQTPTASSLRDIGLSSYTNSDGSLTAVIPLRQRFEYDKKTNEPKDGVNLSTWGYAFLDIPKFMEFLYDGVYNWKDMLWGKYNSEKYNSFIFTRSELENGGESLFAMTILTMSGVAALELGLVQLTHTLSPIIKQWAIKQISNPVNWGAAAGDAINQVAWILIDPYLTYKDFNFTGTFTNLLGLRPYGQAIYSNILPFTMKDGLQFDHSGEAISRAIFGGVGNRFGSYWLGNTGGFYNSMFIYTITNSSASSLTYNPWE